MEFGCWVRTKWFADIVKAGRPWSLTAVPSKEPEPMTKAGAKVRGRWHAAKASYRSTVPRTRQTPA